MDILVNTVSCNGQLNVIQLGVNENTILGSFYKNTIGGVGGYHKTYEIFGGFFTNKILMWTEEVIFK